MFETTGICESF